MLKKIKFSALEKPNQSQILQAEKTNDMGVKIGKKLEVESVILDTEMEKNIVGYQKGNMETPKELF